MIVEGKAAARMAEGRIFRWLQLAMGIVCMAMIANLQYGWTLFVDPIDAKYHWGRTAIQLAFTLFVVTETWLVPVEAWFVDKYGPRVVTMFGGAMITLAWVLNSYAESLLLLYLAAIISGIGAGSVYGTCVGNALKWFPDRRGLAAGATAAGFGAGAAIIAFATAALMLLTLSTYGHNPVVFVLATAAYFGVFGEIYSLFPATSGDTFGVKFAATNSGMLYTAKGTAALLVPLASIAAAHYGWQAVFVIAVALNATAALMALFVIRPMRRAFSLGSEVRTADMTSEAVAAGAQPRSPS